MKRRLSGPLPLLVFLGLLLLDLGLPVVWGQTGSAERLAAAKSQFEDGEFQAASALLRALLQEPVEPSIRLEASLHLGLSELKNGREEEALAAFAEVLRLQPDHRLEPALYAKDVRDVFEKARMRSMGGSDMTLGISILEPEGVLSKSEKAPVAFARKWYQKWWVLALGGAVAVGATVAIAGGGGESGPEALVFEEGGITVETAPCLTDRQRYPEGEIRMKASFSGGVGPFDVTFNAPVRGKVFGLPPDTIRVNSSPATYTYSELLVAGGGSATTYVIRIEVKDSAGQRQEADKSVSVTNLIGCKP